MPLSKNFIARDLTDTLAISHEPRTLEQGLKGQAFKYTHESRVSGDFKMDKMISEYIGVDQIEREAQRARELDWTRWAAIDGLTTAVDTPGNA